MDEQLIESLSLAAENIFKFHSEQKDRDLWMTEVSPGVPVGQKVVPWIPLGLMFLAAGPLIQALH